MDRDFGHHSHWNGWFDLAKFPEKFAGNHQTDRNIYFWFDYSHHYVGIDVFIAIIDSTYGGKDNCFSGSRFLSNWYNTPGYVNDQSPEPG